MDDADQDSFDGIATLSDDDTGEDVGLDAGHDFRAYFPVAPWSGRGVHVAGAATVGVSPTPCPRCGCKHTMERATWNPPKGECPAAALSALVRQDTKVHDASAWPQAAVCLRCKLCGAAAGAAQPCPKGSGCDGHMLGDFVCMHGPLPGGVGACPACRSAGKDRPCPCDICACARLDVGQHPLRWLLGSHDRIKKRAERGRARASIAQLLPSVAQSLDARNVTSRHVQAAVARSLVGGGRGAPIPCQLRNLIGGASIDENLSADSNTGACARGAGHGRAASAAASAAPPPPRGRRWRQLP
jgi:hypothetical protein